MPHDDDRIAILGLGLMGASLGMALRATGRMVAGYDAAPGVAARAHERGAVDVAGDSVADAVRDAQLIVLAAPVLAMRDLLADLAQHVAPNALVTDLGSTKAQVVAWADELLPNPGRFVGGHPMTGSERSGVEAAHANLYRGCLWCLTPTTRTSAPAVERMERLIRELGARSHVLDAARHDAAVALVSHLPLIAASALVLAASSAPGWPDGQVLAAGGWRDTTRVASGSPRMARDICQSNRAPLLAALDAYLTALRELREQIVAGDMGVEEHFAEAQRARDAWLGAAEINHRDDGDHRG